MIKKSGNKWFTHQTKHENAVVNLICFVFAGGSPSFYAPWKKLIPDWINIIPVLYPMREKRLSEKMPENLNALVTEFYNDNKELLDKKVAIWGHCSGALIGMEYARMIEASDKKNSLSAFIVSGCEEPEKALIRLKGKDETRDLSELTDEQIKGDLRRFQMMDADMLEDETFCKYFIPLFKADLGLFRSYKPTSEPRLSCPAIVMNGRDDKSLIKEGVAIWQKYFKNEVTFKEYCGEHYFVNDQKETIISDIADFIVKEHCIKK